MHFHRHIAKYTHPTYFPTHILYMLLDIIYCWRAANEGKKSFRFKLINLQIKKKRSEYTQIIFLAISYSYTNLSPSDVKIGNWEAWTLTCLHILFFFCATADDNFTKGFLFFSFCTYCKYLLIAVRRHMYMLVCVYEYSRYVYLYAFLIFVCYCYVFLLFPTCKSALNKYYKIYEEGKSKDNIWWRKNMLFWFKCLFHFTMLPLRIYRN